MSIESQNWWDGIVGGAEDIIGLTTKVISITDKPEPAQVQQPIRQTIQTEFQQPAPQPFNWKPWAIGSGIVLGAVAVLLTILKVLKD